MSEKKNVSRQIIGGKGDKQCRNFVKLIMIFFHGISLCTGVHRNTRNSVLIFPIGFIILLMAV